MDIKKTLFLSWGWLLFSVLFLIIIISFAIYIAISPIKEYKAVLMQEKPSITWKQEGRFFRKIEKIKVYSPELGTVIATIPNMNIANDSYFDTDLILERDTYPLAQGKTIWVNIKYDTDNNLIITKAWTE